MLSIVAFEIASGSTEGAAGIVNLRSVPPTVPTTTVFPYEAVLLLLETLWWLCNALSALSRED